MIDHSPLKKIDENSEINTIVGKVEYGNID